MPLNYDELKSNLHSKILEDIDWESLNHLDETTSQKQVGQHLQEILQQEKTPLTSDERRQLVREVLNELFGLGPLEPLLSDPSISDILVNGPKVIYVERRGVIEGTDVCFNDAQHLMRIIERMVSRVGRRVDESSPMVDARLQDGSRVNVIIAPLALDGPIVSIRRFPADALTEEDLLRYNGLTESMLELLKVAVIGKLNIVVSGGTGSGKTTLLNILSASIPSGERIITIEDTAELRLKQDHVVRLETRPPNIEGKGTVKQRQLVINALRMRPDRIVIGEVRGEEAMDMLQAMNTGHEGSLTTIHANTPRDALNRLETMVTMANLNLPDKGIRQQMASAIDLVVQATRLPDGSRKVTCISEVTGMEGPVVTMQDLFVFERQGYDENNKVRGRFQATGIRPQFSERLAAAGLHLPAGMFTNEIYPMASEKVR